MSTCLVRKQLYKTDFSLSERTRIRGLKVGDVVQEVIVFINAAYASNVSIVVGFDWDKEFAVGLGDVNAQAIGGYISHPLSVASTQGLIYVYVVNNTGSPIVSGKGSVFTEIIEI